MYLIMNRAALPPSLEKEGVRLPVSVPVIFLLLLALFSDIWNCLSYFEGEHLEGLNNLCWLNSELESEFQTVKVSE